MNLAKKTAELTGVLVVAEMVELTGVFVVVRMVLEKVVLMAAL